MKWYINIKLTGYSAEHVDGIVVFVGSQIIYTENCENRKPTLTLKNKHRLKTSNILCWSGHARSNQSNILTSKSLKYISLKLYLQIKTTTGFFTKCLILLNLDFISNPCFGVQTCGASSGDLRMCIIFFPISSASNFQKMR